MDGREYIVQLVLAHGQLRLHELLRFSRVSRDWREAVCGVLPTLRALVFCGCKAHLTGPDVLAVLARVAGGNLSIIDLAHCKRLDGADVEKILACVSATCPRVTAIDLEGCSVEAQLRALAIRTRALSGAASPRALFEFLSASHELQEGGATRCSLEHLCALLAQGPPPSLVLDLVPGQDALQDAVRMLGSAWDVSVLLIVSFPTGEAGGMRTFGYKQRNVHSAAAGGHTALLELLVRAGAAFLQVHSHNSDAVYDQKGDTPLLAACRAGQLETAKMLLVMGAEVSAANAQGDTPLLLAFRAGNLEFAKELLDKGADALAADKEGETLLMLACRAGNFQLATELLGRGADVSAGDNQGETPLLAAVAAGNTELALDLVARGATVEALRADGANVLSLAIFSQNDACIKFALTQGPKRLEGQGAMDSCTFIKCLAQAFFDARTIGTWVRNGVSPSALMGEIGVLMSSADLDAEVKDRLEHVCAFLNHHQAILQDLSHWPEMLSASEISATERMDYLAVGCWVRAANSPNSAPKKFVADNRMKKAVPYSSLGKVEEIDENGYANIDFAGIGKQWVSKDWCGNLLVLSQTDVIQERLKREEVVTSLLTRAAGALDVPGQPRFPALDAAMHPCRRTLKVGGFDDDDNVGSSLHKLHDIAFSPDGSRVACAVRRKVVVYNVRTGLVVAQMKGDESIKCLAFSPNGRFIATGDDCPYREGGTVRLYCASTGKVEWACRVHECSPRHGGFMLLQSLCFSPCGTMVASGYKTQGSLFLIYCWSAKNGDPIDALDERGCWCKSEIESRCGSSARSSRGILAANDGEGDVTFHAGNFDTSESALWQWHNEHESKKVSSMAWSPCGRWLMTCSGLKVGRHGEFCRCWRCEAVSPRTVYIYDTEKRLIKLSLLWQAPSPPSIFGNHYDEVWRVAFSPCGSKMVTAYGTSVAIFSAGSLADADAAGAAGELVDAAEEEDHLSLGAGLQFPVGLVKSYLKKDLNPKELIPKEEDRMDEIAIFLTATLEYLCLELLELAGNSAHNNSRQAITMVDLQCAISNDAELDQVFRQVSGFVLGHPPGCPPPEGRWLTGPGPEAEGNRDLLRREMAVGESGERLTDCHCFIWKVLKQVHPYTSLLKVANKAINGFLLEVYRKIKLCLSSMVRHVVEYLLDQIQENARWIEEQAVESRKDIEDATNELKALALQLTDDQDNKPSLIAELQMLLARSFWIHILCPGPDSLLQLIQRQSGAGGGAEDGASCGVSASNGTFKELSVQDLQIAVHIVLRGNQLAKHALIDGNKALLVHNLQKLKQRCGTDHEYQLHAKGRWFLLHRTCVFYLRERKSQRVRESHVRM